MKTRQCDECYWFAIEGGESTDCAKLHQPRFYKPRHALDQLWGFKRKCEDFVSHAEFEKANGRYLK